MWQSTITCSLDYTFISFEMVTCYGSDRFASCDTALPSLARWREVVTGTAQSIGDDRMLNPTGPLGSIMRWSSLGIALAVQGFHRYESLIAHSIARVASPKLTLGGDKPVIPGVAFIR
jgi:hypothetical protein